MTQLRLAYSRVNPLRPRSSSSLSNLSPRDSLWQPLELKLQDSIVRLRQIAQDDPTTAAAVVDVLDTLLHDLSRPGRVKA